MIPSSKLVWLAAAFSVVITARTAQAQDFDHAKCFEWVIDKTEYTAPSVTVTFSLTNPQPGIAPCGTNTTWALSRDYELFYGSLTVEFGWAAKDYTNVGSQWTTTTLPQGGGRAAAYPIRINALSNAISTGVAGQYTVTLELPPEATGTGAVGIEGRAAWWNGTAWDRVPVRSAVDYFVIDGPLEPRRQVVDIAKCQRCHNGASRNSAGGTIPRLSMHGNNRNENLELCAICHNPAQTDIPYRSAGAEVSIDFKRMVHSIHASKFRESEPFTVIGFNGSINDFSRTPFPAEIRNCLLCHVDTAGQGTFEIPPTAPVATFVAGSTVKSGSTPGCWSANCGSVPRGTVDLDPMNDIKITPIAAVCSSCHDRRDPMRHMVSTGNASFAVLQQDIQYWVNGTPGTERCPTCHGPGQRKDVRRAHQISGSTNGTR